MPFAAFGLMSLLCIAYSIILLARDPLRRVRRAQLYRVRLWPLGLSVPFHFYFGLRAIRWNNRAPSDLQRGNEAEVAGGNVRSREVMGITACQAGVKWLRLDSWKSICLRLPDPKSVKRWL